MISMINAVLTFFVYPGKGNDRQRDFDNMSGKRAVLFKTKTPEQAEELARQYILRYGFADKDSKLKNMYLVVNYKSNEYVEIVKG